MLTKRFPEILLALSALFLVALPFVFPLTKLQKETIQAQGILNLKDYSSLRRSHFFGHKEMSDIATGMNILANTIDAFHNSKQPNFAQSKIRTRLEDSVGDAVFLSRFSIGMNDIYIFPALFFLFEEENPELAMKFVHLGMQDSRTDIKVPLLGGFIAHIFMRDIKKAGEFYQTLSQKYPNVPKWVSDLSKRLLAGEDPYLSNPQLKNRLQSVITKAFPNAKSYFERQEEKRRRGEIK